MRSEHAEKFNHDEDAPDYDADVSDESNPIRAGYAELLDWVAAQAGRPRTVVELGTGTANLTLRLAGWERLVCVDVSTEMLRIAREKLRGRDNVELVVADLLEFFDREPPNCDVVVSSYAIHHLTADEKRLLWSRIGDLLEPGGRAVFGDLMFADPAHRARYLAETRAAGHAELADEIEDEFFWDVAESVADLRELGLAVEVRQFSELSWGICAEKPGTATTAQR